jgi:hypothetical protein
VPIRPEIDTTASGENQECGNKRPASDDDIVILDKEPPKKGKVAGRKTGLAYLNELNEVATRLQASNGRRSDVVRQKRMEQEAAMLASKEAEEKARSDRAKKSAQTRVRKTAQMVIDSKVQVEQAIKREKEAARLSLEREKEASKRREQELLKQLAEAKKVTSALEVSNKHPGAAEHHVTTIQPMQAISRRDHLDGTSYLPPSDQNVRYGSTNVLSSIPTQDFTSRDSYTSRSMTAEARTATSSTHPRDEDTAALLYRLDMHEAQTRLARLKDLQIADAEAAVKYLAREGIINGYRRY